MSDGKVEYLQMIQEPICRTSTSSSVLKGFAATIVAGISMISYSSTNTLVLALSFLPVLAFAALDVYYLMLEKKFRYLFDLVRNGGHEIDYSLSITLSKSEKRIAKARIRDCIKSPSICLFYPLMLLILITVLILKFTKEI